jgi:phosphatidylglycerol---prolipoprotein diacylglyceryl transferase
MEAFSAAHLAAFKKLPILAMSDLIAPAFLMGYSFGRIGCLLNGCCYGGVCTANLPAIEFPQGSGPYIDQLASAKLLGIELTPNSTDVEHRLPATVQRVNEGSLADKMGMTVGSVLNEVDFYQIPRKVGDDPAAAPYIEAYVKFDDKTVRLASETLPPYSLPVHPSQIYAAINAALLCWFIWKLLPVASHDGLTFLVAVFLYGVSRFVLEGIRSDEAGQLGTSLTISQWIGMITAIICAILAVILLRTPMKRAWY